jgi:hypothetical protein
LIKTKKKFSMGHCNLKAIYRKLGEKIDGTTTRAPLNQALYEILKELYTSREAEVLVRMPYGISSFEQIAPSSKFDQTELYKVLENLCERGTLQNQLFNDLQSIIHKIPRGFFVGFLRLPGMKQTLMSDLLRSRFLTALKAGAQKQS